MTPREAAKALAANDPALMNYEQCECCGAEQRDHGGIAYELIHHPDCPWLMSPQIVAALEAAERVASIIDDLERWEGRLDHSSEEWSALCTLRDELLVSGSHQTY